MKTVTIQQAKANFFELVDYVSRGGEVIITRGMKPVAKLVPYHRQPRSKRSQLPAAR